MSIHLKVIQGKQRGKFLDFPTGEFLFGRGPECHVQPDSDLISRQHCLLRVDAKGAFLRDLGSTNGTLVNGHRILEELSLSPGDRLQLGPLVLEVVSEGKDVQAMNSTIHEDTLRQVGETIDSRDLPKQNEVPPC